MANGTSIAQGITELLPSATQLTGQTATQITGQITASQGGNGLSSLAAGYTFMGNGTTTLTAVPYSSRLIAYATAMALTASGDVLLTMSNAANLGSYVVRRVTFGLPNTAALATVVVVATLRTASNSGGTAITGALVVTGLSATTAFLDQTVTLASAVTTASQLFVNVTTAAGTAPSSMLFVYADGLGV